MAGLLDLKTIEDEDTFIKYLTSFNESLATIRCQLFNKALLETTCDVHDSHNFKKN